MTHRSPLRPRPAGLPGWLLAAAFGVVAVAVPRAQAPLRTLSLVATTDLHGYIDPRNGLGGLAVFGGYVENLRAVRRADGGGVLLVDAGDTWLGGTASNLSEGAVVVDAYNALGYTALAVGNHDLEFGVADAWWARPGQPPDLRGALKARARQARFPFLAANLVDTASGQPVAWPNVQPSAMVDVAGVRVGLVGVMTRDALSLTLAPNVEGLATTPLAEAVVREARALRARGATVVAVVAHAGGACGDLARADDLSSCDAGAEIFEVARALPPGLVDVIAAGHTHDAVAHHVAGVPIVQAYSWGRAFGRVDLRVRADAGVVEAAVIHAPHEICAWRHASTGACAVEGTVGAVRAVYEARPVVPRDTVRAAMADTLARVQQLRATGVGLALEAPIVRGDGPGDSPLGNFVADAVRAAVPGADAALSFGGGPGGLRADLPPGPVTLGTLYDVFPFDNRIEVVGLTRADLEVLVRDHRQRPRWGARALGVSGLTITDGCGGSGTEVSVAGADGRPLPPAQVLTVAMSDFLAARARRLGVGRVREGGRDGPLVREALVAWVRGLTRGAGRYTATSVRWRMAAVTPDACAP